MTGPRRGRRCLAHATRAAPVAIVVAAPAAELALALAHRCGAGRRRRDWRCSPVRGLLVITHSQSAS